MNKLSDFDYEHYVNRLAALVDGPEGSELGEEGKNRRY